LRSLAGLQLLILDDWGLDVNGGQNPRKSGDMEKIGTRLAAGIAASSRRTLGGARRPVESPCQDRQPPQAVAECQSLQGDAIGLTSVAEFIGVCPGRARVSSRGSSSTTDEFRRIYADSRRR
jgi:hypothetical protein